MSSFSRPSQYKEIKITRDDTSIFIDWKTVNFSYYESIFSPVITGSLTYVDTGDLAKSNKSVDVQERTGTLLEALPIQGRGREKISFKIENASGQLDFTSNPLYVSNPIPIFQENNQRESVVLRLVSKYSIDNENSNIYSKYYNTISSSIKKLLVDELKVSEDKLDIDSTSNSDSINGLGQRAFDICIEMASRSVSTSGGPGFFFWETKEGLHFKALDTLVKSSPVETYKYHQISQSHIEGTEVNYRILNSPSYKNNSNLTNDLRSGLFRTKNISFDLSSFEYKQEFINLSSLGFETLNNYTDYSEVFNENENFTRTNFFILDSGLNDPGISTVVTNNQRFYLPQSLMRYNLLMSQVLDITIPCNLKLKAGDTIECQFAKISSENLSSGSIGQLQSGKYLITHLCHNFTSRYSYTSLRIVRDTFGIYKSS
jgi:hypothetical protein